MKVLLVFIFICVAFSTTPFSYGQKVIIKDLNKTGLSQAKMEKSQNEENHDAHLSHLPLPDTSKMSVKNCVILNVNDSIKRSSVNSAKLGKVLHHWNIAR